MSEEDKKRNTDASEDESKNDSKQSESSESKKKNESKNGDADSTNKKSREQKEKEIQDLLKQLRELEKQKQSSKQPGKARPGMIMIEFGSKFHHNGLINFAMYFLVNLLVIYSLAELFDFVSFSGVLLDFLMFIGLYTLIEIIFRHYVVYNHFRFVMRTMGFIFFFGYLTLFYLLENYIFIDLFSFRNETMFVLFMGAFIVFRYLLSHFIRNIILRYMR